MYSRPIDSSRQRIKLPENYSGNAFSEQSLYGDMPPPAKLSPPPPRQEKTSPELNEVEKETSELRISPENLEKDRDETSESPKNELSSFFSPILPPSTLSSGHFPFGHGIGSEEILIIALMLTVYLSGTEEKNIDHELMLLLGLLLFAG